jgi:predicted ribosome quality control (RQC) complex YloA/Tae2 family protein
MQSSGIDW